MISLQYPEHPYFPDGNGTEARAVVAEMKDLITGIGATPLAVIGSQTLSIETIMRLPKKPNFKVPYNELRRIWMPLVVHQTL